jgi:hypothetical protein
VPRHQAEQMSEESQTSEFARRDVRRREVRDKLLQLFTTLVGAALSLLASVLAVPREAITRIAQTAAIAALAITASVAVMYYLLRHLRSRDAALRLVRQQLKESYFQALLYSPLRPRKYVGGGHG